MTVNEETKNLLLTHFAESTVHGLPQAVKAKSMLGRIIWLVLFFAAIAAFHYHLMKLAMRFAEKPVNFESEFRAAPFEFPDLYICNTMTFSSSLISKHRKENPQEAAAIGEELNKVEIAIKKVNETLRQKYRIINELKLQTLLLNLKIRVLFSSIDLPRLYKNFVHSREQTIIAAKLNGKDLELEWFAIHPHHEFLYCLKFLNTSALRSPNNELLLYLFTDAWQGRDGGGATAVSYKDGYIFDMEAGLFLLLTNKGAYPGEGAQKIFLSSGMHTDISVSMKKRKLLNTASRPCSQKVSYLSYLNHLSFITGNETVSFKRDYFQCFMHTWSVNFYEKCGCIPSDYPIPVELKGLATKCLNATTQSTQRMINYLLYRDRLDKKETFKNSIVDSCKSAAACVTEEYNTNVYNALWPSVTSMPFLDKYIIRPKYQERLEQNHSVPGWDHLLYGLQHPNMTEIVRTNLLRVTIRPAEESSTVWTESEAYPIFNLVSDIGGILGLYLGMSLLTIGELFDIFILLNKSSAVISRSAKSTAKADNNIVA